MIYFGFVELIEKFIEWLKRYAEPIDPVFYWVNVFISALSLALGFHVWVESSFDTALPFLIFGGTYGVIISVAFSFGLGRKKKKVGNEVNKPET